MDSFYISIGINDKPDLEVNVTHEEYEAIKDIVLYNPQDNDLYTFCIENGVGELIFRPSEIKYIKY